MNSGLMRLALEYAQTFGIPVADHPEDLALSSSGQMNEGLVATRLGLAGKPNAMEDIHILRDIMLAELTGGHIHLQHISTRFGVESIRQALARLRHRRHDVILLQTLDREELRFGFTQPSPFAMTDGLSWPTLLGGPEAAGELPGWHTRC